MAEKIIKLIKNNWVGIIVVIVFCVAGLGLSDWYYKFFDFLNRNPDRPAHQHAVILAFHAVETVVLTFILVVVAWVQLKSLNKTGKADFLLRLDERFSNAQVLEARTYIHELYARFRPRCRHSILGSVCVACHAGHMQKIRDEIKRKRHDVKFAKKFMQLKNLLELFETISYFSNEDHVDPVDIDRLVGGIIEFHYEVFMDWIHYLQDTKGNENFSEFERLVYKINKYLIPESRRSRYQGAACKCRKLLRF